MQHCGTPQVTSCFAVFLAPRWSVGRGDTPVMCGLWILARPVGAENPVTSCDYITRQLYRTLTASMTPTTNNPAVA